MKLIPLQGKHGQGKYAIVDDEDFSRVSEFIWRLNSHGYVLHETGRDKSAKRIRLSRLIVGARTAQQHVDHINHDLLDNRKENLRICDNRHNQWNAKPKGGKSGFKGVHWNKGAWQARIKFFGRFITLGRFTEKEDAARAYNEKAKELFGEFAWLNPV